MPSAPSQKYRSVLACVVVGAAAAASLAAFAWPEREVTDRSTPGLFFYETGGFRYEYHAPTGHEGLYDLRASRTAVADVLRDHPDIAAKCRHALEERLQVSSLDSLRSDYADTIRRLEALGYL